MKADVGSDDGNSRQSQLSPLEIVTAFTIGKIDHFLSAPTESVYPDLKKLCDTVSESYRDRVVVELLQNAHDAHDPDATNGRIRFVFAEEGDWGTLYVANDGDGFTEPNFRALCSPTRTTKTVNEAIGNKGVGFLSTFQVCDHPEIYSRAAPESATFDGFSFRFGDADNVTALLAAEGRVDQTALIVEQMPRLYLACPLRSAGEHIASLAEQGFATVVRLELKNEEAKNAVADQLRKLAAGNPPVHLFLTRLAELTIEIESETTTLDRDPIVLKKGAGFRLQDVGCAGRRYIIAQRVIDHGTILATIRHDVEMQALPSTWLDWEGDATVSLAVAKDGAPLSGRYYNFLPMGEGAHAPFAGHLDAPFRATLERLNIQSGVKLNELFLSVARELAIDAARACREHLKAGEAQMAVADLLFWTGQGRDAVLNSVLQASDALIPVIGTGSRARWARLSDIRRWPDDPFLTAQKAAAVGSAAVLDPALGPERLASLATFGGQQIRLAPDWSEKRAVAEATAEDLHRKKASIKTWDEFYRALQRMFATKPAELLGAKVLLTERHELTATDAPTQTVGRRRPKRLSALFLPPLRANEGGGDLPRAVRQRLAYLHHELEVSRSSSAPARSLLLSAGVVREHQAREILRLLASAIEDTGSAADPEALRWQALETVMRIARDEEVSETVIAELNLRVPANGKWIRADTAYFGGGWPGVAGNRLESLFETAKGLSADLDGQGDNLLRPYRQWRVAPGKQADWVQFLIQAGVRDHLRPLLAFPGSAPRSDYGPPFDEVRRRAALPTDQTVAWTSVLGEPTDYPNPYTAYTISGAYRLPGQADFEALAPVAGRPYAEQVLRVLDAEPAKLKMRLYRPNHAQRHERAIASPIEAFVRAAKWVPTIKGLVRLDDAWIGTENKTAPPGLPIIEYEFRTQMLRHEAADTKLRDLGMPAYGSADSAWRLLVVASSYVTEAKDTAEAERWLSASQEAWSRADLKESAPTGLRLVCRSGGSIIAVDPTDPASPVIIIADGDDRQLLAAKLRAPGAAIFEPPPTHLADVSAFLQRSFGERVLRTSTLRATYVAAGKAVVADPGDPLIEVELGERLREIVALTLRFNNSFYRADVEEVLQKLSAIRIRWLGELSVQVGDVVEPIVNFEDRAVFLRETPPTILVHEKLRESDRLLIRIAEALAEGLGSRRLLTNTLVAFVAQLDGNPLAGTHADFARVLQISEQQVKGALGVTRAAIGSLLVTLRPVVEYYCGPEVAARFTQGGGLLSEDDVAIALNALTEMPEDADALIRRCRDGSSLGVIASALGLDLSRFNAVLARLGLPYELVDLTAEHEARLQIFLEKRAPLIRDAIRAAFKPRFDAGEDLTTYLVARNAPRPTLPEGFGRSHVDLSQSTMEGWLVEWMKALGVEGQVQPEAGLEPMETVQAANLRLLRQLAPRMRAILMAKTTSDHPLRAKWATQASAQQLITATAEAGGWIDFERIDGARSVAWLQRAELWPRNWPATLELGDLELSEADLEAVHAADEAARLAAASKPKSMKWAGGDFRFDADSWAEVADSISAMVEANDVLTATSNRVAKGVAPILSRSRGGGGGGGGGPGSRMTQDERDFVGFCGEAIAFAWIRARFGKGRVIDHSCWRSSFSEHVTSAKGDNMLGYDFEVRNGETRWYFEVKATSGPGPQAVQGIELGSTEIAHAEACKSDNRWRFRILYVTDALYPEKARLFVLPNPRSEEGKRFFAEPAATGVRLMFGLPV